MTKGKTMQTQDQPGGYYVSALLSGKYFMMAGPYASHDSALAEVPRVRKIAEEHDRRAVWAAFGTSRLRVESPPLGILNQKGLM